MKVYNVEDCIKELATVEGVSKIEATKRFNDCLRIIESNCLKGGVAFKNLFTIRIVKRKGRKGVINNSEYVSEDYNTLKLIPSKKMAEMLNKSQI